MLSSFSVSMRSTGISTEWQSRGRDRARRVASRPRQRELVGAGPWRAMGSAGDTRQIAAFAAHENAGLRAAEQLVAAEDEEIGRPVGEPPPDGRAHRSVPSREKIHQPTRCPDHRRRRSRARAPSRPSSTTATSAVKARHLKVRAMDLQEHSCHQPVQRSVRNRSDWVRFVVPTSTTLAPARAHDVRNAERGRRFSNQLPPRGTRSHSPAACEGAERPARDGRRRRCSRRARPAAAGQLDPARSRQIA